MSDLLKTGELWLADQQKRFASSPVTYGRGEATVSVYATIGRSEWDVVDGGAMLRVESKDFIIARADLVLESLEIVPAPGDTITEDGYTYEVSSPGPGMQHWRWDGPARTRYRVHTKQIGAGS